MTYVSPGSEASKAGLRGGQIVTHMNAIPVVRAVQEMGVRGWMWGIKNPATAAARKKESYRAAVRASVGSQRGWTIDGVGTVTLIAEDDNYATWNITAPTTLSLSTSPGQFVNVRGNNGEAKDPVKYRVLPSGYGYIGLADESGDYKARYVRALQALENTSGLIVDIRGNNGGDCLVIRTNA